MRPTDEAIVLAIAAAFGAHPNAVWAWLRDVKETANKRFDKDLMETEIESIHHWLKTRTSDRQVADDPRAKPVSENLWTALEDAYITGVNRAIEGLQGGEPWKGELAQKSWKDAPERNP